MVKDRRLQDRRFFLGDTMASSVLKKVIGMLVFYGRYSLSFTEIGYRVRRLAWPKDTRDFSGQHWLVTGASGGLGREIALTAAAGGAQVIAAARSAQKLAALPGVQPERCDFTSLAETQGLIERVAALGRPLDVLVNNVGVLNAECTITAEGFEASFISNLLSHYQLTQGLIERGVLRPGSIVINMTSGGAYMAPLQTAFLNVPDPAHFSGIAAYAMHKRAQIVLNECWREQYRELGIECYVMHPGWADTAGVQRSLPGFRKLYRPILRDARSGADTALWLAEVRPSQPEGPCLWFDRKPRTTHAFAVTQQGDTPESLMHLLQSALQGVRPSG